MVEAYTLLLKGEIEKAYHYARERLSKDKDKGAFKDVFNVLVVKRSIKDLGKFLELYKDLYGEDDLYWNNRAIYCFRMLKVNELKKILKNHKIDDNIKFWILSACGYTDIAKKMIKGSDLRQMQIDLLLGNPVKKDRIVKDTPLSKVLLEKFETTRKIMLGNISFANEDINKTIEQLLDRGFTGYALDLMVLKSYIDKLTLLMAKEIAKYIGDLYNLAKLLLIESLWRGSLTVKRVPNIPYLKVLHNYVLYTLGQTQEFKRFKGLDGLYYFWWYIDKIRKNALYLKFSGRLELMRGDRPISINKKQLIILAYIKTVGRKKLIERSAEFFKNSRDPKRRVFEYIARLGNYKFCPTDLRIAYKTGNLLSEEKGFWVEDIKEYCKSMFK